MEHWARARGGGGWTASDVHINMHNKHSDTHGHGHVWFSRDLWHDWRWGSNVLAHHCAHVHVEDVAKTAIITGYIFNIAFWSHLKVLVSGSLVKRRYAVGCLV